MGSEKVTKTLGLDNMKRCYLDNPIAWFGDFVCSAINSTKTFDYLKQPCETVKGCQVMVCPEKVETSTTFETMEEVKPPTKTRQRKRNRNRKRKKQSKNNMAVCEDIEMKTAECVEARGQGGDCDVVDGCWIPKLKFRCRLSSECESEDSFIVFDDSTDSHCYKIDSVEPESDLDDGCSYMYHFDVASEDSATKKVRFANPDQLCEVHPMVKWSYAYRNARKGPWEQYALDRMRFQNRINSAKPVLEYVLQPAHRNEIYKDRFMDAK